MNGILLGLALLMAAARQVIRFHSQGKLHPDDFVLMFASSIFVASQVLLYILKIENIYWLGARAYEPMNPQNLALLQDSEALYRQVLKFQRMVFSSLALIWISIYAVKICFLLFFYPMIIRLRNLILAWRVIFGITILFCAFCICAVFIVYPHFGPTSGKSALSPPTLFCSLLITAPNSA